VFASKLPESEKLEGVPHALRDGVPVLAGVVAWATCELRELIPGGDHTIAIGNVIGLGHRVRHSSGASGVFSASGCRKNANSAAVTHRSRPGEAEG